MTVRTNTQAIYAKTHASAGSDETLTKANLIPISPDISKTFLEDNSIERPELRGGFGANDSVIISQTQGVSIPTFIQGGGVASGKKNPLAPPVAPLLKACFHTEAFLDASLVAQSSADDQRVIRYAPTDDDVVGAALLYRIDDIEQKMTSAKGTMSLSIEVGSFATMTFEMQSPYTAPTENNSAVSGTAPTFQQTLAVSGQNTFRVPGLNDDYASCVRSFSLSQNVTISAIDCATQDGFNAIKYVQTARAATGELVFDMDEDKVEKLAEVWGGQGALKSNFAIASNAVTGGLIQLGEVDTSAKKYKNTGNQFVVAANNYKFGAPTVGDSDGIATWSFPITFIPSGGKPDYELYYIGDLSA